MHNALKAYGEALAAVVTAYARQLAQGDEGKAREIVEQIGSGEMRVVIVSQLVPFSVHALHLDPDDNQRELFKISEALH
jgi:hypothetical protein